MRRSLSWPSDCGDAEIAAQALGRRPFDEALDAVAGWHKSRLNIRQQIAVATRLAAAIGRRSGCVTCACYGVGFVAGAGRDTDQPHKPLFGVLVKTDRRDDR